MSAVLGLDIGGSHTRGWLCDERGVVVARAEAGGGNPNSSGRAALRRALAEVKAGVEAGPPPAAVAAGAAGLEAPGNSQFVRSLLARTWPGVPLVVVPDVRLVLEAAGLQVGIALVAGTGSIALAAGPGGRESRAGGWGHLLGDEGSGYWMVREALRRVLAERDRGLPPGPLATILLDAMGVDDLMELPAAFHRGRLSVRWAGLAPLVLEADPDLVDAAAAALADTVLVAASAAGIEGPIVLAGGLARNRRLATKLRERLVERLPGTQVIALRHPPILGAIRLARRMLTDPSSTQH